MVSVRASGLENHVDVASPCRVMREVRFVRPSQHQMNRTTGHEIDSKSIRASMGQTEGYSGAVIFALSLQITYVRETSKRFDWLMVRRIGDMHFSAHLVIAEAADQEACPL